jgi:hypothetical protein
MLIVEVVLLVLAFGIPVSLVAVGLWYKRGR